MNEWAIYLTVFSAVSMLASIVVIPIILVRLPAEFFQETYHRGWVAKHRHQAFRLAGHIMKNLVGLVLLLLGIAMLFLPGQGILTIIFGLALLDFPGKFTLEQRLIRAPRVYRTINRLRRKFGRPALVLDERPAPGTRERVGG